MTKHEHMGVSVEYSEVDNSGCGYFNSTFKFGRKNRVVVTNDNISMEYCSVDHYFKVIGGGFIIPLFPIFNGSETFIGSEYVRRWVRVTNLGDGNIIVNASFTPIARHVENVSFAFGNTPGSRGKAIAEFDNSEIILKSGEYFWVDIPLDEMFSLTVYSSGKSQTVKFAPITTVGWAMPV